MQALPGSELVAYIATQETTAANELFLVPASGPASAGTKASGPLVAGGSVNSIHAVPEGGRVLYTADAETFGLLELYIADQGMPIVGFPTGAAAVSETDGVADLPVTLSNASISLVSVQFRVTGGTATQASDYLLAAGTLSILPGQTSAAIPLTLIGDLSAEGDETIIVTIESPSNATLGLSTLTVTLRDGQIYLPLVTRS
jgi:Calx-beta domain